MPMNLSLGLSICAGGGVKLPPSRTPSYPNFPATTLAEFHTTMDIIVQAANTITDEVMTDSPYGVTAMQFVVGTASVSVIPITALSGINVQGGNIRWTFKPMANFATGNNKAFSLFEIRLFSTSNPASPGTNYHRYGFRAIAAKLSTEPAVGTGRFQTVSVPVSRFTANGTGADLSSIKFAALVLRTTSTTATFGIGDVDFIPNPRTRPAIIYRFDGCRIQHYTDFFPALQSAGRVGVCVAGDQASGTYPDGGAGMLTSANLTEMLAAGWQFCPTFWASESAAVVDAMTPAERNADFTTARNYAKTNFNAYDDSGDGMYHGTVGFNDMIAYPQLAGNFRSLANFLSPGLSSAPIVDGETFPPMDRHSIIAWGADVWNATNDSVTAVRNCIDYTITNNGVLILVYHNTTIPSDSFSGFTESLTYRASELDNYTIRGIIDPWLATYGPYTGPL